MIHLLHSLRMFARWSAKPCWEVKVGGAVKLARIALKGVDDHGEVAVGGELRRQLAAAHFRCRRTYLVGEQTHIGRLVSHHIGDNENAVGGGFVGWVGYVYLGYIPQISMPICFKASEQLEREKMYLDLSSCLRLPWDLRGGGRPCSSALAGVMTSNYSWFAQAFLVQKVLGGNVEAVSFCTHLTDSSAAWN